MSRINRGRVTDDDTINASDLNATYADYQQAGTLDASNTRDQAFDLPHFSSSMRLILNAQSDRLIGNGEKQHPSATGVQVAALSSPNLFTHVVNDGAGSNTFLDWSADPWQIGEGEYLRVWWNLSVRHERSGRENANQAGVLGRYVVPAIGGGTETVTDSYHCWLAFLEWDVTSASLTHWVPVPGQMPPGTDIDGVGGNGFFCHSLNGATVISAWTYSSFGFGDGGEMPLGNDGKVFDHEWFAPYGMYVHKQTSGTVTVYGVRLVLIGLLHPAHVVGGNAENILLIDYSANVDQSLYYTSGRMSAVHGKVQ